LRLGRTGRGSTRYVGPGRGGRDVISITSRDHFIGEMTQGREVVITSHRGRGAYEGRGGAYEARGGRGGAFEGCGGRGEVFIRAESRGGNLTSHVDID
jgi:hypothetical protein